jgi:hypothetical protein
VLPFPPGVGAKVGDRVAYVVSNELVDPHDPAKGKSPVVVFLSDWAVSREWEMTGSRSQILIEATSMVPR